MKSYSLIHGRYITYAIRSCNMRSRDLENTQFGVIDHAWPIRYSQTVLKIWNVYLRPFQRHDIGAKNLQIQITWPVADRGVDDWGDRFEFWLAGPYRRRNHPRQILWQSVQGFWSSDTPNFALLHRNSWSPLQQCKHCRATLWWPTWTITVHYCNTARVIFQWPDLDLQALRVIPFDIALWWTSRDRVSTN